MGVRTADAYEFLEQIGEGTYGQVYRARDRATNEIVAMKKLRLVGKSSSQGLPQATVREIRILRHLKHPNLVDLREIVTSLGSTTFAAEEAEAAAEAAANGTRWCGNLFLVFEYVEHDLTGLVDMAYAFTPIIIKTIMQQLLGVLAFLHDEGFVHRDIKSSNLLIDNQHRVKLADLGLARSRDPETAMTNKVITLWYRPPELLLGAVHYGPAVDLWSVGCIMVELMLGRPLLPGKAESDQLGRIFDLMGTPDEASWPGFRELPHADKMFPPGALAKPSRLRAELAPLSGVAPDALDLIEGLLAMDPRRRLSAAAALESAYFRSEPRAADPADLPPVRSDGHNFHEFQTKAARRAKREAAKQAERTAKKRRRRAAAAASSPSRDSKAERAARERAKADDAERRRAQRQIDELSRRRSEEDSLLAEMFA